MLGNKLQGEKGKKNVMWEIKMGTNIKTEKPYTEQDFKIILLRLI